MFTHRHSHRVRDLAGHVTGSSETGVLEKAASLSLSPESAVRKTHGNPRPALGGPALLRGCIFLFLMDTADP